MTFRVKVLYRQWHQRILALLLLTLLVLIGSLAFKIYEQNQVTETKDLTIQASNFTRMKAQEFNILATMIRQDYDTYKEFQDHMGAVEDLTALALASNQSYQSRFLESVAHWRQTMPFGERMGAVYLFLEAEDFKLDWYWDQNTSHAATSALIQEIYKLRPKSASSAYFQFLQVLDMQYLLYLIPLTGEELVICVFDAKREFTGAPFYLEVSDTLGSTHIKGFGNPTNYEFVDHLRGLTLRFATDGRRDGFLPLIMTIALIALILLLYQFHIAQEESHTHELTGLPNMRTFDGHLRQALKRPGTTFLLFLDLRSLKHLNTIFLEEQADEIIKQFAKTLRQTLDHTDQIVHRSGDELLIILTVDDTQLLEPILQRLRKAFWKTTLRLQVRQARDAKGKPLTLYGQTLKRDAFIDYPISFRIGGFAIDDADHYRSQKAMLDYANLLAEEAKQLEDETIPGVVWKISYTKNKREYILQTKPEDAPGPRLLSRN